MPTPHLLPRAVLLIAALGLLACAGDGPQSPYFDVRPGVHGLVSPPPGAAAPGPSVAPSWTDFPMYAGGDGEELGTLIGQVRVRTSAVIGNSANVEIRYQTTGYCLHETHLQVSLELSDVRQKNGNPSPGQLEQSGKHEGCTTQVDYTKSIDLGPGHNYLIIAAHAVVSGADASTSIPGANYASGNNLPVFVTGRRDGNDGAITNFPVPRPVVNAWEPPTNVDPSSWDTGITTAGTVANGGPANDAANRDNGTWLLNNGADWVWESFRSNQQLNPDGSTTTDNLLSEVGAAVRMQATVNVVAPVTGTFRITCDAGYRVSLNGGRANPADAADNLRSQLADAFEPATTTDLKQANVSHDGWQSVESFAVNLIAGANTFEIWGVNEYMRSADDVEFTGGPNHASDGTNASNPAGCIFGLEVPAVPGASIDRTAAWGAPNAFDGKEASFGNFPGNNWATYFIYRVR